MLLGPRWWTGRTGLPKKTVKYAPCTFEKVISSAGRYDTVLFPTIFHLIKTVRIIYLVFGDKFQVYSLTCAMKSFEPMF